MKKVQSNAYQGECRCCHYWTDVQDFELRGIGLYAYCTICSNTYLRYMWRDHSKTDIAATLGWLANAWVDMNDQRARLYQLIENQQKSVR